MGGSPIRPASSRALPPSPRASSREKDALRISDARDDGGRPRGIASRIGENFPSSRTGFAVRLETTRVQHGKERRLPLRPLRLCVSRSRLCSVCADALAGASCGGEGGGDRGADAGDARSRGRGEGGASAARDLADLRGGCVRDHAEHDHDAVRGLGRASRASRSRGRRCPRRCRPGCRDSRARAA